MKKRKLLNFLLVFVICVTFVIPQTSCGLHEKVEDTGFYLDTTCTIEIDNMNKSKATALIDEAFKECRRYEQLFSRTIKGSDIYKINHAQGKPVKVAPETIELINDALSICKETDGLFDITVGQLTSLWNFSSENPKVPAQADIDKALSTVNYKNIIVKDDTVQLKNPDTWLELGAIAKGFIGDKLSMYLRDNGVTSGLINLGGNIITLGQADDGKGPWAIGIAAPYTHQQEVVGKVDMIDETLVTSGVYERYFEENNKKYHHVLNPKTGYPVKTDILGISIRGDENNSTWCDGYSTTCLLLGSKKAKEYMKEKKDFSYAIITTDGNISEGNNFNMELVE